MIGCVTPAGKDPRINKNKRVQEKFRMLLIKGDETKSVIPPTSIAIAPTIKMIEDEASCFIKREIIAISRPVGKNRIAVKTGITNIKARTSFKLFPGLVL